MSKYSFKYSLLMILLVLEGLRTVNVRIRAAECTLSRTVLASMITRLYVLTCTVCVNICAHLRICYTQKTIHMQRSGLSSLITATVDIDQNTASFSSASLPSKPY